MILKTCLEKHASIIYPIRATERGRAKGVNRGLFLKGKCTAISAEWCIESKR